VESPLAIDGDFGEEQITVEHPKGFDVGCGVAIWSRRVSGYDMEGVRIEHLIIEGNTIEAKNPVLDRRPRTGGNISGK
jgi:hypothetical protein